MLLTAASKLERLMVGAANTGMLKDSSVAQISATLYYQASVIDKLNTSKAFKNKFTNTVFKQIKEDFGLYVDALARSKPKSLHHVYEWGKAGNSTNRLFTLNKLSSEGISFQLNYELLPSKKFVPSSKTNKKYIFENKAEVIEKGMPVIISPKASKRLVFEIDGEVVFMPKGASVTVPRPGGKAATNQFKLAYSRFFSGDLVNLSIKKSGFQKIFSSAMARALGVPSTIKTVQYKFSPNSIRSQADAALEAAFGGAL
jgi:hypothetical protein